MFMNETTASQYAEDTLDPIALSTHIKTTNYHYYLCLMRRYSKQCHPLYLSQEGYEALRADDGQLMDSFRLHTDTLLHVLQLCEPGELSVWVGMDHMDWFPPVVSSPHPLTLDGRMVEGAQTKAINVCELTKAIKALHLALKPGGRAYWRSAALSPWYVRLFKENGFQTKCISVCIQTLAEFAFD